MTASTQIRKDLRALGPLGRRGQGHAIDPLVEQLAWVLGLEHDVDGEMAILTHRLSSE
jgi:NADH/NAD ratio-sensing transcriptional regulator Rex